MVWRLGRLEEGGGGVCVMKLEQRPNILDCSACVKNSTRHLNLLRSVQTHTGISSALSGMSATIKSVKFLQMAAKCFKMAPPPPPRPTQRATLTSWADPQRKHSKNWNVNMLSAALAAEINDAERGRFHQSDIVRVNRAQMLGGSSASPSWACKLWFCLVEKSESVLWSTKTSVGD